MQILPLHIEKEKSELVDDNPEIHISSIEKWATLGCLKN